MTTEYTAIRFELGESDVALLTFNRPNSMNSFDRALLEETHRAIESISNNEVKARALVITGEGRAFCAGADLMAAQGQFAQPRERRDFGGPLETHYHPIMLALRNLPVPFVTAVNGAAAGAGMSVALAGDMIVASENAYFLQAFKAIGLIPDAGATYMLPRMIGRARAMELSFLGERLPAAKALEWGMINRVTPEGEALPEAMKLAKELAEGPTRAFALTRDLYWRSADATFEEQLNYERQAQRVATKTKDCEEGVMAFIQKRKANYTGE
ncbi:MAG: enoyl-CoA hydratase-related protein [Pseudomonadota bacterium]